MNVQGVYDHHHMLGLVFRAGDLYLSISLFISSFTRVQEGYYFPLCNNLPLLIHERETGHEFKLFARVEFWN